MPDAKDEYGKGYADGRKEAEYRNSHTAFDLMIRNIGYDPKKSDSTAYKGGFDQGVKDGCNKD